MCQFLLYPTPFDVVSVNFDVHGNFLSVIPSSHPRVLHCCFVGHNSCTEAFHQTLIFLLYSMQINFYVLFNIYRSWATAMMIVQYWITRALSNSPQSCHALRDLTGQLLTPLFFPLWFRCTPLALLRIAVARPTSCNWFRGRCGSLCMSNSYENILKASLQRTHSKIGCGRSSKSSRPVLQTRKDLRRLFCRQTMSSPDSEELIHMQHATSSSSDRAWWISLHLAETHLRPVKCKTILCIHKH